MTATGARLRLFAAAALFSTGGAAVKASSFAGWQIACVRSAVAALTLLIVLPEARRLARPRVWLVGLSYAATMILFVTANKLTTAANVIFLQSTAPLYLLVLAPLVLREPLRRRDLGVMAVIAAGMALLLSGGEEATAIASDPRLGNLLALAGGVAWATTVLGLRWLERRDDGGSGRGLGASAVVAGNLLAAGIALPFALPLPAAPAVDWVLIAYLGTLQIGLAYLWLTAAMGQVPALEASLLLLLEPVLNPLWAWALLGESPSRLAIVGGLLILAAVLARAAWEARGSRRTVRPVAEG